jgi:hypothetical protein
MSFRTERRTSSGSAFQRGGAAVASRCTSARKDSISRISIGAGAVVERADAFRLDDDHPNGCGAFHVVLYGHVSDAKAKAGHGPVTVTSGA